MTKSSRIDSHPTRSTNKASVRPTTKDVVSDSEDERVAIAAAAASTKASTPSNRKRRRTDDDEQQQEDSHVLSRRSSLSAIPSSKLAKPRFVAAVKIIVTPTKEPIFTSYLPTPPITPVTQASTDDVAPSASTSSCSNVYTRARACLRLSADSGDQQLVGRDVEREQLDSFLAAHFVAGKLEAAATPKALYISGSPGTGKTALLTATLANFSSQNADASVSFVNCTSLRDADAIWDQLAGDLGLFRPTGKGKGKQTRFDEAAFEMAVFQDGCQKS